MLNIFVETIPHEEQRYDTVGDYFYIVDDQLVIKISEQQNKWYEYLILLHELVEIILTEHRGITEESISKFDMEHPELSDPGSSIEAPYHDEHMMAMDIEKLICSQLNIDWEKYNENLL